MNDFTKLINSRSVAYSADCSVSDISDINIKTTNQNYVLTFDAQNNYNLALFKTPESLYLTL
jgi:hypothetical protein